MRTLVDADACSVKQIIVRMAKQRNIPITMLIDTSHELTDRYSTIITMYKQFDSVDYAIEKDSRQILEYDKWISQGQLSKAIEDKRVYISKTENVILGFARYNLFWDNTPFLNMIYVPDGYNRMGVGSGLLKFWENEMKKQGYSILLTSTKTKEQGQHFF